MVDSVIRVRRLIAAAASLVLIFGIATLPRPSSAAGNPTPEQLLAATVHAADLAGVAPGGWWDDMPEFNGHLDPALSKTLLFYVVNHVFGKPDANPSQVDSAIDLYATAADAASDFARLAKSDRKSFGPFTAGSKIGDASRYMTTAAQPKQGPYTTVRFRSGRYLVRITAFIGTKTPPATAMVSSIARKVLARVRQLRAGTLASAALPGFAGRLPGATSAFGPVLGTAPANGKWWIWSAKGGTYVVSPSLRPFVWAIKSGVMRTYVLHSHPADVVSAIVMQFTSDAAAVRYFAENRKLNPQSMGGSDTSISVKAPHGPDSGYSALFRRGRYAVSVECEAPFAKTTPACADAVRTFARQMAERLNRQTRK